jgi:hypothetical protein
MNNSKQPAFPVAEPVLDGQRIKGMNYTGISVREYFAVMALQGIISNDAPLYGDDIQANVASLAVGYADALLTELAKTPETEN